MAVDNLNYYSSGLPAGQQTDKYSSQPGCLKSKNLDIFSSSKSVKATAWSEATAISSDIIKQDGKLKLKTDGKVYEETINGDVLVVDPSTNFPVYKVCYTGKNGTYADATWGTVKDMVVKNVGDEWQAFAVYTDRSAYYYSRTRYTHTKELNSQYTRWRLVDGLNRGEGGYIWWYENSAGSQSINFDIKIHDCNEYAKTPVRLKINAGAGADFSTWQVTITGPNKKKYYYDAELDQIVSGDDDGAFNIALSGSLADGFTLILPMIPTAGDQNWNFDIKWGYSWDGGNIGVDANAFISYDTYSTGTADPTFSPDDSMKDGDYNGYYGYLPIDDNRRFQKIGEYYWLPAQTFQTLYEWTGNWVDKDGEKVVIYKFQAYMGWNNPTEMTVIGMISWNEAIYMIGNMDGNGYIFPCDLSGGRGTPYIAYGCEFTGVTNIDYLMYLVGTDRGISQLWVFNQQELVAILGGSQTSSDDIIDSAEQYNFDGRMVEYRGDLVLTTSDNRVFQYGQTFGGKGGTFVNDIPGTITDLKVNGNDLSVEYTVTSGGTTTKYTTTYQDDTPIKNYNTEWEAVYPIVLGNHLLEKEESDLYASYILPSSDCKLEFRASANHYHFWTFKVPHETTTPAVGDERYISGCGLGAGKLAFVERVDDYLTFKLIGKLPRMTEDIDGQLYKFGKPFMEYISYSEINHFRKIGEITADKFEEGEFRFTNLNNKLELPKSHSLQVKVIGKGNQNYTPELFALDLVANQRERG